MAFASSCLDKAFLLCPQRLPRLDRLSCNYSDARPLHSKWQCSTCVLPSRLSLSQSIVRCTQPDNDNDNDDEDDDDDEISRIPPPQYISYTDPNTGEPAPAYATDRNTIPDRPFWPADMPAITRRAQAKVPQKSSSSGRTATQKAKPGSRRRRTTATAANSDTEKVKQQVPKFEQNEEEDEDEFRDEYISFKDPEEKQQQPDKGPEKQQLNPLPNEKLWYNWRKLPPEKEPWHEWCTPAPDSNAAMAAAAAQAGQIKLFGEKPTVAETTLYKARRHALKKERLEIEARRRKEIGPLAYYSEWVKAWKKDTSLEAVQKHMEETGEDVSTQLLEMFSHQTQAEYRIMMGTDVRIQRDPLAMRMTLEQKKAVWGGDPVYPTINYIQDPKQKIDYRGANFHEPRMDLWDKLENEGRVITQEQLRQIQEAESASHLSLEKQMEDAIAGAVDIGEKEDEEENQDKDEKREEEESTGPSDSN